jgi:hypothetical protein
MDEIELTQAILDYITEFYKAEYTGYISVTREDTKYVVKLGLPSYMYLTTISGDFESDQDFLDYVYEELRTRNYMRVYFYKVVRTLNTREE